MKKKSSPEYLSDPETVTTCFFQKKIKSGPLTTGVQYQKTVFFESVLYSAVTSVLYQGGGGGRNSDFSPKKLKISVVLRKIKKIKTKDKKFDPNFHQAMSEIEDESKDTGSILQEIQSGYMLGERLLRPALVSVAKKKTTKKEEKNQKKEDK